MKDGRPRIGCEDISPELGPRKPAADVHHEVERLTPLLYTLARETKNNIERRDHFCLNAALNGLVNVAQILEAFVHELHHCGRGGFNALTDLMQAGAVKEA